MLFSISPLSPKHFVMLHNYESNYFLKVVYQSEGRKNKKELIATTRSKKASCGSKEEKVSLLSQEYWESGF